MRKGLAIAGLLLCLPAVGAAQLQDADLPEGDLPYVVQQQFKSPASGDSFYAFVLRAPLPAYSSDFDGCPHPAINTLAYTLVIDPASGWVDTPQGFGLAQPERVAELTAKLPPPRFHRSAPESLPWAGAYPWEKFENAALLSEAAGLGDWATGNWWLSAAWSVRLDVVSGNNPFDPEVEELFALLPAPKMDPADLLTPRELSLARQIEDLGANGRLISVTPAKAAIARAWLYRSRGELEGVRSCLAAAAASDKSMVESSDLYNFLLSSAELERQYLRNALPCFERSSGAKEGGPQQAGRAAFLAAEIRRRTGDLPGALTWYDNAKRAAGAANPQVIDRQIALCQGRGY